MENNAVKPREDLLSFFENIADHDLHTLFNIIHEIKNVLEFESKEEQITFEMFAGLLWRYTAGATMVRGGKHRFLLEDLEDAEE